MQHQNLQDSLYQGCRLYSIKIYLYFLFSVFALLPISAACYCMLNSFLLCLIVPSDLTELQVAVSDTNSRYETLGGELKERLGRQQASLELRQKARQGTDELKSWLTDREHSLKQGQTASPSKPEVVHAQVQENKVKDWVHLLCMFCDHFSAFGHLVYILTFALS